MTEYKVLNDRKRKPATRFVSIIFGIVIIMMGIFLPSPIGLVLGPLLIWSAFFEKYTIVTAEGIMVHYNARLFKYKEEWLFKDVTNLHLEKVRDPDYAVLHFTKGSLSKRLVFQAGDAEDIIDLALAANDKIFFKEI